MGESSRPDPSAGGPGAPWRPSLGWLAVAAGLVAGALAWWGMTMSADVAAAAPEGAPLVAASGATAAASSVRVVVRSDARAAAASAPEREKGTPAVPPPPAGRHVSRRRDPYGDQTPDLSDFVNDGAIPTTAEVIDRLHQAGIHEGLGAFSPPGTRPPLIGLAVPEGFELPPGYVRHYQATDDGQRIEAVLMFSPDVRLLDADGQPVAIPPDRVVPPELAPPGLPIRRITIPPPLRGAGPGG